MTLQLLRPGEPPLSAEELGARAVSAVAVPSGQELPARAPGVALYASMDAVGPADTSPCRSAAGEAARSPDASLLGCPNNPQQRAHQEAAGKNVDRAEIDGVLLDAPDGWYAAGRTGAGFCEHCEAAFQASLHADLLEQFAPGPLLPAIAKQSNAAPFWREREAVRLRSAIENGLGLARTLRDEARREKNVELPVGARLTGISAVAVELARRLDFVAVNAVAPSPDRFGLGGYEILRAALGNRPLTVLASDEFSRKTTMVAQAARLAVAVGAELSLPASAPAASQAALTQHRQYWRELRARYRPSERLAEVLVLYSSQSDHWSQGGHGQAVQAVTELLTRLGVQYRVVLEAPRNGSEPLVIPDAAFVAEEDAGRLERRVTEGAGAIVVGAFATSDETGRTLSGPFELSDGLNRIGSGSVIRLDAPANWDRGADVLQAPLDKALESLLGRGRRSVSVSRPTVLAKLYLDPDRKLDVHLVGRQFAPTTGAPEEVKGLVVHLAGSAVSGARTGYFYSQGEPERRVSLSAFGTGVQTTLPDFSGSAILSITR